eukprot:scaffold245_cov102-Skeletonema_marinoi.AAC.2
MKSAVEKKSLQIKSSGGVGGRCLTCVAAAKGYRHTSSSQSSTSSDLTSPLSPPSVHTKRLPKQSSSPSRHPQIPPPSKSQDHRRYGTHQRTSSRYYPAVNCNASTLQGKAAKRSLRRRRKEEKYRLSNRLSAHKELCRVYVGIGWGVGWRKEDGGLGMSRMRRLKRPKDGEKLPSSAMDAAGL